jgi:TonB family protein
VHDADKSSCIAAGSIGRSSSDRNQFAARSVSGPDGNATVVAPKRLLAAEPAWPAASTRCREQGKVTITYCVSATGAVENVLVVISSGYARLDNAVLAWAARDRHTPGTVNGRARLYCGMKMEQEFDLPEATIGQSAR